jgi:hypothetical protein
MIQDLNIMKIQKEKVREERENNEKALAELMKQF